MNKHILSIFLAACLAFLAPAMASAQQTLLQKEASAQLTDAMADYTARRFADAIKKFSTIVDMDPANDAAYYYMGLASCSMGDLKAGETYLKEAVALDPHNFWYKDSLAKLYAGTNREELTVDIYENLLKEYPTRNELYYNLLNLYAKQGQVDRMLSTLDDIETFSGKTENVTMARYDILMRLGKRDEALKALEAFTEDFDSPEILSAMGDHHMQQYDDSLALRCYEEALSCIYNYPPALLGESEVYRMRRQYPEFFSVLGRFVESEDVEAEHKSSYISTLLQHVEPQFVRNFRPQLDSLVDKALACHPKDTSMASTAAGYYYSTDRKDRSVDILRHNVMENPESFSAVANYVQILSYTEDWQSLAVVADKAVGVFPQEPAFINMKILAHYNLEDHDAVLDDCRQLLDRFPADSAVVLSTLSTMGDTYHLQGNSRMAYKTYDKALKLNPDYAPVLNNYAYYLSEEGKSLKKAEKMSAKTIKAEPDNATYLDTYAWILHLLKRDEEAKPVFKHAMLYGGKESSTILSHYAEVLEALGESDIATVYRNMAANRKAEEEKKK